MPAVRADQTWCRSDLGRTHWPWPGDVSGGWPVALLELANLTLLAPEGEGPIGRILAQMPDPMRPDLPALTFMIVLLVVLYLYLRVVFFQPITQVMPDRDRDLS